MKKQYLCSLAIWAGALTFPLAVGATTAPPPCPDNGKYLYWTGEVNGDFFNENNWRETTQSPSAPTPPGPGTTGKPAQKAKPYCLPGVNKLPYQICLNQPNLSNDKHPKPGTLDPGVPIGYNLFIADGTVDINGDVTFECPQIGITAEGSTLRFQNQLTNGVLSLDEETDAYFALNNGLGADAVVNLLDAQSWVRFQATTPDQLVAQRLGALWVNDVAGVYKQNLRINQYYQKGAIARVISPDYQPLEIFSGANRTGRSAGLAESTIYTGGGIPNGMDNAMQSFRLKRGYMVTLAVEENGTSKSKVYIASEKDLTVDLLPAALRGTVSFIRVLPWNWVTKKGTGGYIQGLDAGWFYTWSATNTSKENNEYVPMTWGAGATSDASLNDIIGKYQTTQLLGFNESDNCSDQSGQFNNLCDPAVAVAYYENIMRTGMRLGTPAPRENGPSTWLREFNRIAKAKDVRFDFVAVHWYDWGSSPQNSPFANPQDVFNRFKAYLQRVHDEYQLPIWITEFNANPNRDNSVQAAFLELALPYLEQLDYVERYAYFQPNPQFASTNVATANYFDASGNLTNIGSIYLNHTSTPSIPEDTYINSSNLLGMDQPWAEQAPRLRPFEAECALYPGSQWDMKSDGDASNQLVIQGNPGKAGASAIAKQVHFEFDLDGSESYRLWVRARANGNSSIRVKMDGGEFATIGGITGSGFFWYKIPRFYDLKAGKHRLTFEFPNASLELDQVVFTTSSAAVRLAPQPAMSCTPGAQPWGLVQTNVTYFKEAEAASPLGGNWAVKSAPKASNGQYIQSADGQSSLNAAPEAAGQAVFEITVAESDHYDIWGKIQSKGGAGNIYWIKVDNEPFRPWANLGNDLFDWYWKKFHYSQGGEDRSFTHFLSAGTHRITVAYASSSARLDRLAVSSVGRNPADEDPNVVKAVFVSDYEAENAELLGTVAVVDCDKSSNLKQVNMGRAFANGVRFNEVVTDAAGTYELSTHYMSKVNRPFRLLVNGVSQGQKTVNASGNWCFEGGLTAIYKVNITLNEGVNTIELRTVGTGTQPDAPFMDKINLAKVSAGARVATEGETEALGLEVYPNPAATNESIQIKIPASMQPSRLNILDLTGKIHYSTVQEASTGKTISLTPTLPAGLYLIQLQNGVRQQTRKLMVR
ncbi:T9SS type A sorting domain-containing protein [Rudanella paleaurantiibacter]|uniref:T9SS type A sorting domain-containing protein n=1 Tax=Rudanella paleaurantiibacter TaxID=2614655 RepID=A0A7J5TT11_9BACT|nr:glycosyl hydrolase [Rudanella paleaurantiibacter]KAB7726846.1 T9SS type A sorting domain-containing protein [Rudanella paleaurantiibacter]